MSLKYIDHNGAAHDIAGLSPGGNIETGAVATRTGTIPVPALTPEQQSDAIAVTFSEAMPDADYLVLVNNVSTRTICVIQQKTANGFTAWVKNVSASNEVAYNISYTAFKLYEVADAEQLYSKVTDMEAMIPSNASSSNKFATIQDVTGETRSLDRRLDDVEDVVPNTATISNKLATAADVAAAMANAGLKVVDTIPTAPENNDVILYVGATTEDYEKGGIYQYNATQAAWILISTADVDLSTYETSWTGTTAQWNALAQTEKVKYQLVNITDDAAGQTVVDAVTNGDMRPITSNAVYDLINQITTATITLQNATGTMYFKRTGKVVSVYCDLSDISATSTDILIGTIPAGYRPVNSYCAATLFSHGVPYLPAGSVWFYSSGELRIYKQSGSTTQAYIFATYVTPE